MQQNLKERKKRGRYCSDLDSSVFCFASFYLFFSSLSNLTLNGVPLEGSFSLPFQSVTSAGKKRGRLISTFSFACHGYGQEFSLAFTVNIEHHGAQFSLMMTTTAANFSCPTPPSTPFPPNYSMSFRVKRNSNPRCRARRSNHVGQDVVTTGPIRILRLPTKIRSTSRQEK